MVRKSTEVVTPPHRMFDAHSVEELLLVARSWQTITAIPHEARALIEEMAKRLRDVQAR